jgi:hypothetical protein
VLARPFGSTRTPARSNLLNVSFTEESQ